MKHSADLPVNAVVVSGGSGFVGRALVRALQRAGQPVIVLSRQAGGQQDGAPVLAYHDLDQLAGCRAVVNLAGANIAGGRWTARRRQELRDSRLHTTRLLCDWVRSLAQPPQCFVSASAIGYYGDTAEQAVSEQDGPADDFAARLCRDWEACVALPAGTRSVLLRIGVVIGADGGALQRMLLPFRLGLGGRIGHGRQWMSWIALVDLLQLIRQAIDDPAYAGVYNAVAPAPVRNADFSRALGRALHRPAVLPVPAFILRLLLGEMSCLLLGSQRVLPARLQQQGFGYTCAELPQALLAALSGD